MARKRRTKKLYTELYDNPTTLFPGNGRPGSKPVEVMLFPNGEGEIWIKGSNGTGFRITAGEGRAGMGLTISRFVGGPPITLTPDTMRADNWEERMPEVPDMDQVAITQYHQDERSQAYREAYRNHDLDGFYKKYPEER